VVVQTRENPKLRRPPRIKTCNDALPFTILNFPFLKNEAKIRAIPKVFFFLHHSFPLRCNCRALSRWLRYSMPQAEGPCFCCIWSAQKLYWKLPCIPRSCISENSKFCGRKFLQWLRKNAQVQAEYRPADGYAASIFAGNAARRAEHCSPHTLTDCRQKKTCATRGDWAKHRTKRAARRPPRRRNSLP
jgi:hypothetical protein